MSWEIGKGKLTSYALFPILNPVTNPNLLNSLSKGTENIPAIGNCPWWSIFFPVFDGVLHPFKDLVWMTSHLWSYFLIPFYESEVMLLSAIFLFNSHFFYYSQLGMWARTRHASWLKLKYPSEGLEQKMLCSINYDMSLPHWVNLANVESAVSVLPVSITHVVQTLYPRKVDLRFGQPEDMQVHKEIWHVFIWGVGNLCRRKAGSIYIVSWNEAGSVPSMISQFT